MFVDLDWPLNASSLLSASAELLVYVVVNISVYPVCVGCHSWRNKLYISRSEIYSLANVDINVQYSCKYYKINLNRWRVTAIDRGYFLLARPVYRRLSRKRYKIGSQCYCGSLTWNHRYARIRCSMTFSDLEKWNPRGSIFGQSCIRMLVPFDLEWSNSLCYPDVGTSVFIGDRGSRAQPKGPTASKFFSDLRRTRTRFDVEQPNFARWPY